MHANKLLLLYNSNFLGTMIITCESHLFRARMWYRREGAALGRWLRCEGSFLGHHK